MEFLLAKVDTYTICLVGIWQIDTMILYLQNTTNYFTKYLATWMLQYGTYTLIPTAHCDL